MLLNLLVALGCLSRQEALHAVYPSFALWRWARSWWGREKSRLGKRRPREPALACPRTHTRVHKQIPCVSLSLSSLPNTPWLSLSLLLLFLISSIISLGLFWSLLPFFPFLLPSFWHLLFLWWCLSPKLSCPPTHIGKHILYSHTVYFYHTFSTLKYF